MDNEVKDTLLGLLDEHKRLGIGEQIDYDKFYLYSIITHSTAIEGSTVTEVEAQLLFDEGITSGKRTIVEMNMNLDLKNAYLYGMNWIKNHDDITVDWLIGLSARVMASTGSEYHSIGGEFSAAKGELRKLNVTAGLGGKSYMSYQKVPDRLQAFCNELNARRKSIDVHDTSAIYELSFWAHYELVTIHPWADGNGRMSRLLMNLLQFEYDVLPVKVLKEDKAEYIQSLVDSREEENISIFIDCMSNLHINHLIYDIEQYKSSISSVHDMGNKVVDKSALQKKMVDNWPIKPSLAAKLTDILIFVADKDNITTEMVVQEFAYPSTSAKRYLRQLTDFGYLEAIGGNRNRTYKYRKIGKEE